MGLGMRFLGVAPKRTKRFVGAVLLGMSLFSGASAQLPEPPVNSDIAVRLLPTPDLYSPLDREQIRSHPLPRLLGALGSKALGIGALDFIDQTFDGAVVAAIVSNKDGSSSLAAFVQDREDREKWNSVVSELESLSDDLRSHYGESGEAYPKDLQPYLDEIRYYEPYLSGGVDYKYEVTNGGKGFRITTVFPQDSLLSQMGEPPVFTSDGEVLNRKPTAPPVPLNLVVGAKIKDKSHLSRLMTEGFGPQKNGFWRSRIDGELSMVSTIRGDWIVAADNMDHLGGFLKSLNGQADGWSKNPAFQTVSQNLQADAPFLFFADTQKVLSGIQGQMRMGEVEKRFASLAGPMGYAVVPFEESQFRLEVFLGVNAPEGSELKAFMDSARGMSAADSVSTTNIPWDVSNMFAIDYPNAKALLNGVVALFPEASEQYEMGQDVFAGMLGLDAEAGFDGLFSGPTIVSFERIDIVLNMVEAYTSKYEQYQKRSAEAVPEPYVEVDPDAAEGTDEVDEDAGESPDSEAAPATNPAANVPATFAFQVPVEGNREAIVNLLTPYLGAETTTETLYGVDVISGADGALSYAIDEQWFYLSGGRTDRLMKRMLETAHGRKESLGTIDSWSRFTVGSKGKLLAFGHQKVDAVYSIVKGLILFLGADFRPLATEVGKLRDYHTVVTVRPDGLMITGEIVQGDGR